MRLQWNKALVVGIVLASVAPLGLRAALADDVQFTSFSELSSTIREQDDRINKIEARLAGFSNADAVATDGGATHGDCNSGSNPCDWCCNCRSGGCVGGAELVFLKGYNSFGDAYINTDFHTGFRVWAGVQRDDGLGLRLRYFDYDSGTDAGNSFDVQELDLEVYDSILATCNWNLLVGGGIRYLDIKQGYFDVTPNGALYHITGVGPEITAELTRRLNDRWALYLISHESIIAADNNETFFNGTHGHTDNVCTNIFEIQMGLQYNRGLASGATLFGRIGWESQFFTDIPFGYGSDALMGGVISIGISR